MPLQSLYDLDGSFAVSLPIDDLREAGVVDGRELAESDQQVSVKELGSGAWIVRVPDENGNVPAPSECEMVERLVGQALLENAQPVNIPTAD